MPCAVLYTLISRHSIESCSRADMTHTFDPVCFEAFQQLLAQPDLEDLPRRANLCRLCRDCDEGSCILGSLPELSQPSRVVHDRPIFGRVTRFAPHIR